MIGVLATWIPLGLALGILFLGLGQLVEWIAGTVLPSGLLLPLGFAAILVTGTFAAWLGLSAGVAGAVLVGGGLLGWAVAWRRHRLPRPSLMGAGAVVVTWSLYTLAIALSGQKTFGGYGVVGDPAIHLVGADAILRDPGATAGSFLSFFKGYYDNGYPVGGASALAIVNALSGLDPVETLFPLIAMAMAVLSASTWVLLSSTVAPRWLRAGTAVLAALPALTVSYALMSSLKEILAIAMIATTSGALLVLLDRVASERTSVVALLRSTFPVGLAAAALVASIGPAGALYAAPAGIVVVLVLAFATTFRNAALSALGAVAIGGLLVIPSLSALGGYVAVSGSVLTSQVEMGNLYTGPLPFRESLGVWLANDFRLMSKFYDQTRIAGDLVVLLAIIGTGRVIVYLRRGVSTAAGPFAWGLSTVVATAVVIHVGSPWADAKAMAIAGPPLIAFGGVGLATLWSSRLGRVPAALLAAVVLGGVTASAVYAAYDFGVTPQARFDELATVNQKFAGQGPMVTAEFEEFDRHLLRDVPGDFAGDAYFPIPSRGQYGISADQDELDPAAVQKYPLVLLRVGPDASRPPSNYVRRYRGMYYEVWARDPALAVPTAHLSLGAPATSGVAVPTCSALRAFARTAEPGEELVAAARDPSVTRAFGTLPLPPGWNASTTDPRLTYPFGAGRFAFTMSGFAGGELVDVWMDGTFTRRVTVKANGVAGRVGPGETNPRGPAPVFVKSVRADPAGHVALVITRPGRRLRTGWGHLHALWGPVSLTRHDALSRERLIRVSADSVGALCGKSLDWVELVPSG